MNSTSIVDAIATSLEGIPVSSVNTDVDSVDKNEEDDVDPPCIPDASISDSSEDESGYKVRFRNQLVQHSLKQKTSSQSQPVDPINQLFSPEATTVSASEASLFSKIVENGKQDFTGFKQILCIFLLLLICYYNLC